MATHSWEEMLCEIEKQIRARVKSPYMEAACWVMASKGDDHPSLVEQLGQADADISLATDSKVYQKTMHGLSLIHI